MQVEKPITASSRSIELLDQIKSGLNEYYQDRKKLEVWNKIFWTLSIYMGKDGILSNEVQQTISFYLQKRSQSSLLGPLIEQNKQVVCKIYDFAIQASGSIDDCLSKGNIIEVVNRKLQKVFVGQSPKSPTVQLVSYCIEVVLLHFCEFINRFKIASGNSIMYTNRRIIKVLRKKTNFIISYDIFKNEIMEEPITLLEGYLENIKPNDHHFNMENLFELTNRSFKSKRALLTGYEYPLPQNNKIDLFGKVINFNSIFDSSVHSRELIEKKLDTLTLTSTPDTQINQTWSLLTCVTNNEPFLGSIFEKLPMFLRPRSNGDILSFLHKKIIPSYRYQVLKNGYTEGPFLLEFMQVFTNVGKKSIQIIAIPNTNETQFSLLKHQGENFWEIIQRIEIPYSKVKVLPRSIAIIPENYFYFISDGKDSGSANSLSEVLIWNIFPKQLKSIHNTLKAIADKSKISPGFIPLPLSLMFLDYLNHEYLQMKQQISTFLVSHLQEQLIQEEKTVNQFLTSNPKISLNVNSINYNQRFCYYCKTPYLNYCCQTENKNYICMECAKKYPQEFRVSEILAMYFPQNLRYPMTLFKIKIAKDKQPSEDIESPYEKSVCPGKFVGSFKIYNCKAIENQDTKTLANFPFATDFLEQILFHNIQKQLKIISSQDIIVQLSTKRPKNQQELDTLTQKIKSYCGAINDPSQLTRKLASKIDTGNLVSYTISILMPPISFQQ